MVTKNRDHFFLSAHLLAEAVSRTEAAAAAAGGCPQSVESAVLRAFENAFDVAGAILRAFENASRAPGGCFAHRISLPYRKSLFFTPNASEDASRTGGSLFEHRMRIPYRRSLFLVRRAPKTHRTWLSGAQESGWQLPLRGLSTPGRGRGNAPPETSSALAGRRKWWKGPERTK